MSEKEKSIVSTEANAEKTHNKSTKTNTIRKQTIINHIYDFLLKLGRGFCFVARKKKLSLDGRQYYIDLVFYNYKLKCFILIALKLGELTQQDLELMQMYVNYYTHEMRNEGDNPSIGIVLCEDKSDAIVEYMFAEDNTQTLASQYMTCMPSEEEFKQMLQFEKVENNNK